MNEQTGHQHSGRGHGGFQAAIDGLAAGTLDGETLSKVMDAAADAAATAARAAGGLSTVIANGAGALASLASVAADVAEAASNAGTVDLGAFASAAGGVAETVGDIIGGIARP